MSRETRRRQEWRRRERDFRAKRAGKVPPAKTSPDEGPPRVVEIISYTVTCEPMKQDDPAMERLIADFGQERVDDLYDQVQEDPAQAQPVLEALLERHPKVPMLYNWLTMVYQSTGQRAKLEASIHLNFERNPDYLFAKIAKCEWLLGKGEIEEATRILSGKLDLTAIFPHRRVFHITEVIAFQHLLVNYFVALGEVEQARICLKLMKETSPDHPMTEDANRLIELATFNRPRLFRNRAFSRWT